ncbi:hypothetical protein [Aquimarina sp. RZ0]|uniref:hypothetical protein n=1 Tax=Aquimarina sp. RZ0 TaxID=2607730 RepID=UPI0011F2CB90|nr:hypothetical protein [Aquimarina sp. RZ0]KAA1247375.1 hypothetical protein F0000_03580 [Aquimarina sp. RZ0]
MKKIKVTKAGNTVEFGTHTKIRLKRELENILKKNYLLKYYQPPRKNYLTINYWKTVKRLR